MIDNFIMFALAVLIFLRFFLSTQTYTFKNTVTRAVWRLY